MPNRKKDKSRIKATTAASSSNPASSSATTASTSRNTSPKQNKPSSFENVMEKYAISEKAFSKFKAKVDSGLIPKAVQSSLESMVDEVVKESVEGGVMSISMASTSGGIVKEFTVMGNKLTPTVSVSLQVDSAGEAGSSNASSGNGSQSGGKKRPRDCNSAFETKNCGEKGSATNSNANLDQQQQHQSHSYSFHSREEGDDDEYSEDEYDEDEEDHVIGVCLHCGLEPPPAHSDSGTHDNSISSNTAPGIQVSCDDCHSFICSACHWCHEYQANHEIRVCDRCDAFYCKKCDEMDQCEDCGEVVCGGCGALCSCKFCGCGLCEDCATACGRCGIVLCQRDAKFAVECDTCKMSYCLVCLASGTKDPCVRCGQKTSKRVEQLVHLRLKSIYKAFKQSGAALDNNSKGGTKRSGGGMKDRGLAGMGTMEDIDAMSIPLGLPSGNYGDERNGNYGTGNTPMNGDVGAVLQVAAAAAAASAAASGKGSRCDSSFSSDGPFGGLPRGVHPSKVMPHLNHDGSISFRPRKEPKKNDSDKFASRTEAEANAAAAALLAELDEEKHKVEVSTTAKKSKKKKKKERHAAKEKEKEENTQKEADEKAAKLAQELKEAEGKKGISIDDSQSAGKKKPKKKKVPRIKTQVSPDDESLEDDFIRLAEAARFGVRKTSSKTDSVDDQPQEDDIESRLAKLITANDLDGIEDVLSELKGVPGRAALRKNAKKASKRITEEQAAAEVAKKVRVRVASSRSVTLPSSGSGDNIGGRLWKPTDPLIDFVKKSHRVKPTSGGAPRSECVMQLAPHVVGWVIGKGGQRIRDLMEDSGAKVWIDQDSMGAQYMRIVYVSGSEISVNAAVKTIKDLISLAPMPGSTAPSSMLPNVASDTGSGAITRNSLTSTPVPTQKSADHKSHISPRPRREVAEAFNAGQNNVEEPFSAVSKSSNHSRTLSAPSSPQMYLSVTPTMESMLGTGSPPLTSRQISSSPKVVHELFCEPRFVPLLIGRRGWTIKNIQDLSGARVDIDQKVIPRRIIISGNESQVNDAIRKVDEVLSYPHAQLNYSTTGPDDGEIDIGTLAAMQSGEIHSSFEDGIGEQSLFGLVRGQSLPLDYGALPNNITNGSMSQQSMQQPSSFAYSQQQMSQQSLSGHPTPPEQPFPSNIPSRVGASPVFLNRQRSSPLPEHNVGLQMNSGMNAIGGNDSSFLRGAYSRDQQQPPHIMPLSSHHGNFENVSEGTNSMPILGLGSDGGTLFPGHQRSNDDQSMVNNLFGNPVPVSSRFSTPVDRESANVGVDPLLQGFENLSFGENGNNDLAGWDWDGLMNDEGSSGRRVGLGGVRLDTSIGFLNNSDGSTSNNSNTNQWDI